MRLNRYLAASGLGSRRSCEELILGGSVTVNGQVCQNLATEVKDQDFVKVGSRRIVPEKPLYILLHKPRGYLCTAADTHDRQTIFDLMPGNWPRLFHVGRLDRDSEGLLILTNDGDLALRLTHPRFKIEKEYEVLLDRPYGGAKDTARLVRGVSTEHGRARAESVKQLSPVLLRIVLKQGLKRQIRQMLYKLGYEVKRLIRIRIGMLRLAALRAGEWRVLSGAEVEALRRERVERVDAPGPAGAEEHGPKRPRKDAASGDARGGASARPNLRAAARPRSREKARNKSRSKPRSRFNGQDSASSTPRAVRRP